MTVSKGQRLLPWTLTPSFCRCYLLFVQICKLDITYIVYSFTHHFFLCWSSLFRFPCLYFWLKDLNPHHRKMFISSKTRNSNQPLSPKYNWVSWGTNVFTPFQCHTWIHLYFTLGRLDRFARPRQWSDKSPETNSDKYLHHTTPLCVTILLCGM